MIDFLLFITKRSAIIHFLINKGGGEMLNLVYGSSSSSYVDCVVFFGDEMMPIKFHLSVFQSVSYHYMLVIIQ